MTTPQENGCCCRENTLFSLKKKVSRIDLDKIDNDISIYQEAIGKNEQFHRALYKPIPPPPDQLTTCHPQRMGSFHSQFLYPFSRCEDQAPPTLRRWGMEVIGLVFLRFPI